MWSILRPDLQMQKRTAKTGQSVFPPLLTPPLQKQKKTLDGWDVMSKKYFWLFLKQWTQPGLLSLTSTLLKLFHITDIYI